jgi:methionyl-tRNA synthetase
MHDYLAEFPDKPDILRYALLTNLPETKDSEFTWKDFQAKNNNELVAILGNFVNRALVLTQKYFDNRIPPRGPLTAIDEKALADLAAAPAAIAGSLEAYRFREATAALMDLARVGNKYLADTEPWKLAKTDMPRVGTVLNIALQMAANLAIVAEPFLPFSAGKLREMLQVPPRPWAAAGAADLLESGHELGTASLLFEKLEDPIIEKQIKKLMDTQKDATPTAVAPLKPEIVFDDFSKLDLRVGTVTAATKMEKSDKLLKLTIDDGLQHRTVLSGIAKHYTAEEMVGKQVTFIANLAPRKMMGIESQGMVLMAEDAEGKLRLLQPNQPVNPGATVS